MPDACEHRWVYPIGPQPCDVPGIDYIDWFACLDCSEQFAKIVYRKPRVEVAKPEVVKAPAYIPKHCGVDMGFDGIESQSGRINRSETRWHCRLCTYTVRLPRA